MTNDYLLLIVKTAGLNNAYHSNCLLQITLITKMNKYLHICKVFISEPGKGVGIATGYGLDGPGIESRRG
jgi:hypothetical protein